MKMGTHFLMSNEYDRSGSKGKDEKLVVFYVEAYENKDGMREAGLDPRGVFKKLVVKSKQIAAG
jgi:hypothetical protein